MRVWTPTERLHRPDSGRFRGVWRHALSAASSSRGIDWTTFALGVDDATAGVDDHLDEGDGFENCCSRVGRVLRDIEPIGSL